jgi:hypothetical protein
MTERLPLPSPIVYEARDRVVVGIEFDRKWLATHKPFIGALVDLIEETAMKVRVVLDLDDPDAPPAPPISPAGGGV